MAGKAKAKESVMNEESIADEIVEQTIAEEPIVKEPVKKAPKKFAPDERIECRSVTVGRLDMVGPKSQLLYTWEDMDDITYVEYQDLQALQSRKSRFINKPRFIIEDEDIVAQWNLESMYDKISKQTMEEFFALPITKFKAQLKTMPDGVKDSVKTKAVQMINSEELYDIRKVRAIDEAFGTEFVELFMK